MKKQGLRYVCFFSFFFCGLLLILYLKLSYVILGYLKLSYAHGHQDPDAHGHQDPDAHGHHTVLYSTVPYCTVLYSTVQYCTVLYSTVTS